MSQVWSYHSECITNLKIEQGEKFNVAKVTEEEEVSFLMVIQSLEQYNKSLWYLDTGCIHHLS